jgi:hypothetical protein
MIIRVGRLRELEVPAIAERYHEETASHLRYTIVGGIENFTCWRVACACYPINLSKPRLKKSQSPVTESFNVLNQHTARQYIADNIHEIVKSSGARISQPAQAVR